MSPPWTTRLDAHLGPQGLTLALHGRLPWAARAPRWQQHDATPATRAQAAERLEQALTRARAALQAKGLGWPGRLAVELDDAWVLHSALHGDFRRMGTAAIASAAQRFVEQALGQAAGAQRVAVLPQPDGRSLWLSALPQALCDELASVAARHGLRLQALQPAAQAVVGAGSAWPAHGVLALAQAGGWLLALRRDGSWVHVSQESGGAGSAPQRRADALLQFHGVPAAQQRRWLHTGAGQPVPAGWTAVQAGGLPGPWGPR